MTDKQTNRYASRPSPQPSVQIHTVNFWTYGNVTRPSPQPSVQIHTVNFWTYGNSAGLRPADASTHHNNKQRHGELPPTDRPTAACGRRGAGGVRKAAAAADRTVEAARSAAHDPSRVAQVQTRASGCVGRRSRCRLAAALPAVDVKLGASLGGGHALPGHCPDTHATNMASKSYRQVMLPFQRAEPLVLQLDDSEQGLGKYMCSRK